VPVTYNNLYEQLYQYENLHIAYLEARKEKRYREGVLRYTANLEENLIDLQNHLIYQSYVVSDYHKVIIRIPKKRIIMILPFRDRVLQWAIYRVVNPIFSRSFIKDSYGCVKDKGNLRAVRRIQYWMKLLGRQNKEVYVLSLDIRKYFFRVPHEVILNTLRKKIADERMMWLLETIICSKKSAFGLPHDVIDVEDAELIYDVGMPVGSLVSQMIANIVLNEADQYAKRVLQIPHYIRYMDNFAIFSNDKQELHRYKALMKGFLYENMRLELSAENITRARDGLEFAGYRVWADKLILRKSTTLRMKRSLKHVVQQYRDGAISLEKANSVFQSYRGMLDHCDSNSLTNKVLEDFALIRKSTPE
jgi:retron-type reverse transcriptase